MTLDILIEDDRWARSGFSELAEAAFEATLAALDLDAEIFEASVLACDDSRIKVLNADFRDKDKATNVLSWPSAERAADTPGARPAGPQPGPDSELGDIAIAFDTCAREAAEQGKPFADHVTHLFVHGTLHLLGFDHENEPDAALMEGLEVQILGNMGLPDPYRDVPA